MILIVGGTGDLGQAIARRLLAQARPVRIMTRTPEKAEALKALGAEIVQGDLLDPASLTRACAGVTQVVAAAHSIFGKGREASKYVDLQGHKDLIDAASAAEVDRFVYISVYQYVSQYANVPFWRIKVDVECYLQQSGLNYTILQPTAFMESHAYELIGKPILETGKVTLFGKGENPRNFVAADDVARFVIAALVEGRFYNEAIEVGGPENVTNMDVVRLFEKYVDQPAKVRHVPIGLLKVLYRVVRPIHPGLSQVMQSSILLDTVDATFDSGPMLEQYPIVPTRLEDWVAGQMAQHDELMAAFA
jgi:NADH dehydrogenase